LIAIVSLFRGPLAGPASAGDSPPSGMETKTVLVLHSNEANAPVFAGTDKGLLAVLHSGGIPILNQVFEYLELRRYPLPEHRQLLVEQMRLRHGQRKFDMIVTMYPEALEFVEKDCRDIFAGIPLLALYLPQGFDLQQTGRRLISHWPSLDITGTFEIALRLVPGAKRAYVISGMHPVDQQIEAQARQNLKPWESRLEIRYLSHMPFEDILSALSSASADTIVLLLIYTQDAAGNLYTTPTLARQLSRVSAAPIFGLLDAALDNGIVGGSLISFEAIGTKAGEMILGSLQGKSNVQGFAELLEAPARPMFDLRQVKHWDLDARAIPDGSFVINREFTLWDFKYYIVAVLAFILAQSGLILALLVQKRRRQSAEECLRQRTEELDRFFSVSLDLLCIADMDGLFLRLNPAWEKVLGYSRAELMAKRFFDFVHPDDLAGTRAAVSRLVAQGELTDFHNRYRCQDGSYRSLEWSAASSGSLLCAAARDITERLEIEKEALQRREEFAHLARVATMGELAASLAHEINQPLSAIMSNAQAARRFLDAPAPDLKEIKEILNDIVKEDGRAGEVINRLRTLLKKSTTTFEPVDLNLILQEVARLVHSDAVIRDVTLSLQLDPNLPKVQGDPIQLQQVALNLILNAFDALNERPRGRRRALIRTRVHDSLVVAAVADNGTGIPRGEAEKIFEPFKSSKPQGLGMGLSISRSIINRHHGRIWADSNSEGGATIYFSLPTATERWALLYGQHKR
jgi:PAS domain S-box-containing protein